VFEAVRRGRTELPDHLGRADAQSTAVMTIGSSRNQAQV